MSMKKIILVLLVIAFLAYPSAAAVSDGTVTRSLSASSAAPSATPTITVTLIPNPTTTFASPGWGATETLPAGFVYVSTTADGMTDLGGNQYRFIKLGAGAVEYTVTVAPSIAEYTFTGTFVDASANTGTITGDSAFSVAAAPSTGAVVRSFTSSTVLPGANFDVTLTPNPSATFASPGWGAIETLPAGFVYVSTTSDGVTPLGGNQYRFIMLGSGAVTYTVTASPTQATYTFDGIFVDDSAAPGTVSGATSLSVSSVSSGTVTRTVSPSSVTSSGTFVITLTPAPATSFDSPGWGAIETLPSGFTFVSSTADGVTNLSGNQYRFTMLGSSSFTYTVTAPSSTGSYPVSGVFVDDNAATGTIINTTLDVVSSSGGGGGGSGTGGTLNTTSSKVPITTAEKPVTKKPATENPVTKKPAAEKPATEKPATEKPAEEPKTPGFGLLMAIGTLSIVARRINKRN